MRRNSITPSRAFLTIGAAGEDDRRLAVRAGPAVAHRPGAGRRPASAPPFTSTRHMRQLPAIDSRSWKQKRGISAPAASQACSSVNSGGTSTSMSVDDELGHGELSWVVEPLSSVIARFEGRCERAREPGSPRSVSGIHVDASQQPATFRRRSQEIRTTSGSRSASSLLRRHRAPARHAGSPHTRRSAPRSRAGNARIRPWIGQAAASPSAQIVWPSICLVTSSSMSISRFCARPSAMRVEHAPHPAGALAAGRALAAALVLVEIGDAGDRPDDVGRLVHDDHGRGAEARLQVAQRVEVHRTRR